MKRHVITQVRPCEALILCLMLLGCGSQSETLSEVSGEVTLAGQPVVAEIVFEPTNSGASTGGRASTATSDDKGRFRLMLDDSHAGARIGRHHVTIRVLSVTAESGDATEMDSSTRAAGAMKVSQFTREVVAGRNHFHFPLTL